MRPTLHGGFEEGPNRLTPDKLQSLGFPLGALATHPDRVLLLYGPHIGLPALHNTIGVYPTSPLGNQN